MNHPTAIAFAEALAIIGEVATTHRVAEETLALPRTHGRVLARNQAAPFAPPLGRGERGDDVLRAGEVLTPVRISLAASLGIASLPVARKPTVAVFTSGDELVESGMPRAAGQVHDSSRELLMGLLRADGLEPTAWPRLPDDPRQVEIALRDAGCAFDLIIICGAVAAARTVLEQFGQPHFSQVQMQPGMPVSFGSLDQARLLALAGDPGAVLATYLTLGRALIDGLQGRTEPRPRWHALLTGALHKTHPWREFRPARVHSDPGGRLLADLESDAGAASNALIVVPEGIAHLVAGDPVEVVGPL